MELFYSASLEKGTTRHELIGPEAVHITKVFRKKEDDHILVTNGKGMGWEAEITATQRNSIAISCVKEIFQPPLKYSLHLAIAPTKSKDRMEWLLEKATEIGVTQITPLLCQYSERKHIKLDRWTKILISAAKQSQRFYLPQINPMQDFTSFIASQRPVLLAHCQEGEKTALVRTPLQTDYTICIGPEGDFSSKEIALALTAGGQAISLGDARYRTETAGIIACHTIALRHQVSHL